MKTDSGFLDLVIESSLDGIFAFDLELRFLTWNKAMEAMTGRKAADVIGRIATEVFPHIVGKPTQQLYLRVLAGESISFDDYEFTYLETSERGYCESYWLPVRDSTGKIRGGLSVVRDITNKKKTERELERFFNQPLSLNVIFKKDGSGRKVNKAFLDLFGYSFSEIEKFNIGQLVHPEDLDKTLKAFTNLLETGIPFNIENRYIAKNKSVKTLVWIVSLVDSYVYATAQDVTESREKEIKLRQKEIALSYASKMASLGEMAGGIAHEINTPLSVISLNCERLRGLVAKEEIDRITMKKAVEILDRTAIRIAKIIKNLRYFARDGQDEPLTAISSTQLLDDVLSFCQEKFRRNGVALSVENSKIDIHFQGRSIQLYQVLINLLNNSFDAIANLPEKWIKIEFSDAAQGFQIVVTDSGNGIDPKYHQKIMQPYFTTKEFGKGTGLGLSISKGIIEAHGGRLSIDTKCRNTRFVIDLPKQQSTSA